MIVDTLDQLTNYTSLHPRFRQALEFLESRDLASLQVGKYEIDGKEIHAAVSEKQGVPAEAAKFEAHDRY
ncbi:MAG TPA: YhcH/YjgK/YiaL family protein, partial [Flavisolibacter sp.]